MRAAGLWRRIRAHASRRTVLIAIPVAVVVIAAAIVVPLVLPNECEGRHCRPARNVPTLPTPEPLTPLEAAVQGKYVALGDSYSSGEGTWNAQGDRAYAHGGSADCHRSGESYTHSVARGHEFAGGSVSWACSGAKIANLLRQGQHGEKPQLRHLGPNTSLVTLSIGGNDMGFSTIARNCVVKLPWSSCRDQEPEIRARIAKIPAGLKKVFDEVARRAPKARVLVLSYPRPFPVRPKQSLDNISVDDQRWLDGIVHDLDNTIYRAVRAADHRLAVAHKPGTVEYVDTYKAFAGHELGTAHPYLNALAIDWGARSAKPQSFHPNAAGYRRFGRLVDRQITKGPGRTIYQYH